MNPAAGLTNKRVPASFTRTTLAFFSLLGLILVVFLLLPNGTRRAQFLDVTSPLIDLLATIFLAAAALRSRARSRKLAVSWGTFALAGLLYAGGDVTWAMLELLLKEQPFPSIADGFYLAYYPVFLLGVILLIQRPTSTAELVNNTLDLAVILTAAILGFGNFLIYPILQLSQGAPAFQQAILVAYPVGDLVLLAGLLLILYNDPARPSLPDRQPATQGNEQPAIPVVLLAAGMFVTILSDCAYSYESSMGAYASGGFLDFGWLLGTLLTGLAGVSQWASIQPGNAVASYYPGPVFLARARWIKTYLPYLWLIGAFGLLIAGALMPMPMSFLAIATGVGIILGLVIIRQFVTLSANQRLNMQLRDQATRLEAINQDLNLEITGRLRIQEQLAFDVLHDPMTGLANRRLFLDRMGQAIKRSKRHAGASFGVLFMDLDQFKVVNDSLGHAAGDQLLIGVANRLTQTVRAGDSIARFGGDEFAVLLDEVDHEDSALWVAEKIQDAIGFPFLLQGRELHISASIGIATDLIKYESPEDMLRDVDLAMYQAKELGKARCMMFRPQMREQVLSRLTMEDELRKSIKNGELQLFYQPISSLESGQVIGLEALLRWCHPTKGLLLPLEFLSVAEASDLILPIGEWVLNEACRQLQAWQARYAHLGSLAVNVNISNKEFSQPNLVDKVASALRDSGLQGSSLALEITERVLVDNYPTANSIIGRLRNMGVQVQIDDFGTGYSALAYLQQFPIHAIKIDKSFIREMMQNHKGLGLVRAMVTMASELGMDTVAEGIETGEQLSKLKGLLCGYGQGFLLSAPLDAASAERILSQNS